MTNKTPVLYRNLGALAGAVVAPSAGFILLNSIVVPRESIDLSLAATGMLCLGVIFGLMAGGLAGVFGGILRELLLAPWNSGLIVCVVFAALAGALVAIWTYSRL